MTRLVRWAAAATALAFLALAGLALGMRLVGSDATAWHVDLARMVRPGTPNDFLAATPGFTSAEPDSRLEREGRDPEAFLRAVDRIAMAEQRTRRLAGSPAEGRITYVQRSRVFGFPDYITVEARGRDRAIWSRARFGRDDLGMNRARVERWLDRLSPCRA